MVPQQVHLHEQWLGKRHHECLQLDGQEVIPIGVILFRLSSVFQKKFLFRHLFSVGHYCAYTLRFATP